MAKTFACARCNKRYRTLTKNHKCFFCDKDTWIKEFAPKKEYKK